MKRESGMFRFVGTVGELPDGSRYIQVPGGLPVGLEVTVKVFWVEETEGKESGESELTVEDRARAVSEWLRSTNDWRGMLTELHILVDALDAALAAAAQRPKVEVRISEQRPGGWVVVREEDGEDVELGELLAEMGAEPGDRFTVDVTVR